MKLFVAILATFFLATGAVAGTIAVKVTADTGGPVAGLPVKAEAVAFGTAYTKVITPFKANGTTGGNGIASFTVPDVRQMYEVTVEWMGQVFKSHVLPGAGQPGSIVVPASKVVTQPFIVRTSQNQPVSGARIAISQNNRPVKTVTTDGDGQVRVPLLIGPYTLQVSGNGKNLTHNIYVSQRPDYVQINIDGQGRLTPAAKPLKR